MKKDTTTENRCRAVCAAILSDATVQDLAPRRYAILKSVLDAYGVPASDLAKMEITDRHGAEVADEIYAAYDKLILEINRKIEYEEVSLLPVPEENGFGGALGDDGAAWEIGMRLSETLVGLGADVFAWNEAA